MPQDKFNFYIASYLVEKKESLDEGLFLAQLSNPLFSLCGGKKGHGKKITLSNKQ